MPVFQAKGPELPGSGPFGLCASFAAFMWPAFDFKMSQLCFELIKLQQQNPSIGKEDLVHFCKKIAQMSEIYVSDFYAATKFDPREKITKQEFMDHYESIQGIKFIKLIENLISSSVNFMNYEDNTLN